MFTSPAIETAVSGTKDGTKHGIVHGFFTREGGVSGGIYASLNCGAGSRDDAANVRENKRRAAERFGLDARALVTLYQVHSADVLEISELPAPGAERPKADAMVTRVRGAMLGILTADCAPVLFADAEAGVIGAAHAGWRGAVTGVVENTVRAMEALGADRTRIAASVGPCISQDSYQVGAEFPAPFLARDPANARFFAPDAEPGRHRFDLRGFVLQCLADAGLGQVDVVARDTYADNELFFSYRRTCHRSEEDYGRGLSAIALRG
jgi:YfiH family protein